MINYILILISTFLFSVQFLATKIYSKNNPKSVVTSFSFSLGSNFVMLLYLLATVGFKPQFTLFSLGMATVVALMSVSSSYCSIAALGYINLSMYSMFLMLGATIIPVIAGVLFWNEEITIGKIVCVILIIIALFLGVERSQGGKKGGVKYYFLCFFLNGFSGVVAKIHQSGTNRVDSNSYLVLSSAITCVIAFAVIMIANRKKAAEIFKNKVSLVCMAGYAVVHGVAQLFSLITIEKLPLSLQQPLVTGGVLGFSFIISLVMREKTTKKNVIAFILAVLSVLAISNLDNLINLLV